MRRLFPVLLAVALALAPAFADARPGLGSSMGSRGSRTYSAPPITNTAPSGAAPMQRSYTPNAGSYGSSYGNSSYGQNYGGFGMRPRSAFSSGLLGGLIGAGIGGMLFGHGFFGGMHGGGFLGFLLQMVILFFIARWLFRRFAGQPAMAGGGGFFSRMMQPGPNSGMSGGRPYGTAGGAAPPNGRPIAVTQADYQAFEQTLRNVQGAWTAHDLAALNTMATPEMVGYFGEQLAEQASRGVRNQVTDVHLMQGDLSEAWSEGSREYATVALKFSMIDVTRDQAGRVVDGSPDERVTVTELWTFLRSPGGHWVLSAIQQTR